MNRPTSSRHGGLPASNDLRSAERLLRRVVSAGGHVRYEDLERCVDGTADAALRAGVHAHVRWCSRCAAELADLEAQAPLLRRPVPAPRERVAPWWQRLLGGPVAPALAFSALAVVAVLVMRPTGPADDASHLRTQTDAPVQPLFDRSAFERLGTVSAAAADAHRAGDDRRLAQVLQGPASAGQPVAASVLGVLLAEGRGVPRDRAAAERLLRQAAAAGDAAAGRNLAVLAQLPK